MCVCVLSDMLLEDSGDGSSRKEGHHVKVVVSLDRDPECKEVRHFSVSSLYTEFSFISLLKFSTEFLTPSNINCKSFFFFF